MLHLQLYLRYYHLLAQTEYPHIYQLHQSRLLKATIAAGYYAGAGSVVVNPNGGITIWGVPVVSASWVTDDKVLIFDNSYLERVEVEGLAGVSLVVSLFALA